MKKPFGGRNLCHGVDLAIVQDDVRVQTLIVGHDAAQLGLRVSSMPQQGEGQMVTTEPPRRRRHPEVPVIEAAHIDAIAADRLPHVATKQRAIRDLAAQGNRSSSKKGPRPTDDVRATSASMAWNAAVRRWSTIDTR